MAIFVFFWKRLVELEQMMFWKMWGYLFMSDRSFFWKVLKLVGFLGLKEQKTAYIQKILETSKTINKKSAITMAK